MANHFVPVVRADDLADGESRRFEIGNFSIALFRTGDDFFAINDLCPHMGASLAEGPMDNCIVTCPWHAWRFDIRDGSWCDNPRIRTDSFPVRIVDGMVHVDVSGSPSSDMSKREVGDGEKCPPPAEATAAGVRELVHESGDGGPGIHDFQQLIRRMYYDKDVARGVSGTFMWLMEEVGELATALRSNDQENLAEEFADVLAWLATIANVSGIDLARAVRKKYGEGCPGCSKFVCDCPDAEKP